VKDSLHQAAQDFPEPFRLLVREQCASTNSELHELARQGAPHGLVLTAQHQTAGRGRRGNLWHSAPGDSLAVSVLLRPDEPKSLWPRLALASGLAIAETIDSYGVTAGIKWPNDVWIRRRKVAGVLVEAGDRHVIVGMGLNINTTDFPDEIAWIATSLRQELGTPTPVHEVLARLIQRIAIRQTQIGSDFPKVIESIRERCVLSGQSVSLTTAMGTLHGIIQGIADTGELLLDDGYTLHHLLQADEVRLQP
jgi:BirA family transcriptional regulator, biotin operon repressor / biotin---[acetyl-CoA-carboxylase] ligase